MRPILPLLTALLLAPLAAVHAAAAEGATPPPILATEELAFVREVATATLKNCEVAPGAVAKGKTNTLGFRAITPGGYPAIWIQDFTMNFSSGLIAREDGLRHLQLILEKQNGPAPIDLGRQVIIPAHAIADHINVDGTPVFFPGTYDPSAHMNGDWGFRPPSNNHFDVIWLAHMLAHTGDAKALLNREVAGRTVYERLKLAFAVPEIDPATQLVRTTAARRAVGFIFYDSIEMTGDLLMGSLIRYRAARHLSSLATKMGQPDDARHYTDVAQHIRSHILPVFGDTQGTHGGWLKASTGISGQPEVWGSIYAIYVGAVEGEARTGLLRTITAALAKPGEIEFEGALRQVPLSGDFSPTTMWEKARHPKNTYMNGAYWHVPIGWLLTVLQPEHPELAQAVKRRWLGHLRAEQGKVWECIGWDRKADKNPSFGASITLPLGILSQAEPPPGQLPAKPAALQAAEPISLSADHTAAVNRQRRIFFQYDPAADIQRPGGFGADMAAVMSYVFDGVSQPSSQVDAICIDVSNEGVAHYRSKILPAIQHPGLIKWREQGLDYFDELIKEGHKRKKEIWWGLRMNEVERGDLATYDIKVYAEMKERNPVKAAHPEWLIRSWWWQGFWNYAVKEVRDYRLSIVREVAEQYDFDGVHLDFLRTSPFLPPGKQWENRAHLTDFMRETRRTLQTQATKRGRPLLLAARVPDSVEGCHIDGLDIETWAREGLVDVLILGTRTIKVDVTSFRQAMAGAPVKLLPSFDSYHATDGYHGDQSLDLIRGVFGNYLHQGADGVGVFNGIIGFPEQAEKLGMTKTDPRDLQVFSTIGSLKTMRDQPRYLPIDRRGGYAHNEGYGSSNNNAPLPFDLRNDQAPSTLTLPLWEPVKAGTAARLRLVLFQHVASDEVSVQLNGTSLKQDLVDAQWKDPRIFSPNLQPATVSPGALVKNTATQKLTRLEFVVPAEILLRGDNHIVLSVDRKGPFSPSQYVKVEKVELHLK